MRAVGMPDCLAYCSVEQALADYARVIGALRGASGYVPAVAVGGSYEGMLAAWLRFATVGGRGRGRGLGADLGLARDAPPLFRDAIGRTDDGARAHRGAALAVRAARRHERPRADRDDP